MSSTVFSSNEEAVITRELIIDHSIIGNLESEDLNLYFEINRCTKWIKDNQYERISLQFPDELLNYSTIVAKLLEEQTQKSVVVLADTSYGSCCVDEIAAEHFSSDCIIHFGHSCLSATSRIPVLFVFGNTYLNCKNLVQLILDHPHLKSSSIIIWYDIIYHHAIDEISSLLSNKGVKVSAPTLDILETCKEDNNKKFVLKHCGRTLILNQQEELESSVLFYIGDEDDSTLTNLFFKFKDIETFIFSPKKEEIKKFIPNLNRRLMRRFHLIERTKDAKIIGILVGTLGVANYLDIIEQIKATINAAGKKHYMFVMGKINVEKLANFLEINVYVLVACPENSLIDSKEFYRPIITPFELEVAFNENREWTGDYITDYTRLLPGSLNHVPLSISSNERVDVSLISGGVRSLGVKDSSEDDAPSQAMLKRDSVLTVSEIHSNAAGEFLSTRSWQGLEQQLGETNVSKAREGRKGIALQYENELS